MAITINLDNYLSLDTKLLTIIELDKDMPTDALIKFLSKEFPNLKTLICDSCEELTSIPVLPNLISLNCGVCNKLKEIPVLPSLEELHCYECTGLTSLPVLPNLQKIYCEYSSLTSIPVLPNLRELYCNGSMITNIPDLPNLKYLHCHDSKELSSISNLPSLTILNCGGCDKLTSIPILPRLKSITYSSQIVTIHTVPLMCLENVDADTLTKLLQYNPHNINSIFNVGCVQRNTIINTLDLLVTYLEYADYYTTSLLEELCYDNNVQLPILVKSANKV
jgi:hypothetical protein